MRKVVAFCPWITFGVVPFRIAGVHVMGFREAAARLSGPDGDALWRAPAPYYDHFLGNDKQLQHWNENPLIYVVDPNDPLKDLAPGEVRLVNLVNSFLYVCAFAMNKPGPGGQQNYTNAADWALYVHSVQDPEFFSVGERRLYGNLISGGHRWTHTAFTLPVECNRFRLATVDMSLVEAVTRLHKRRRAQGYLPAIRTFMMGTSDNHLWSRDDDLHLIWSVLEQITKCGSFETCKQAQAAIQVAAKQTHLKADHSITFARAILAKAPNRNYVCRAKFRRGRGGGLSQVDQARSKGATFSFLERALDELNFARNSMVHEGSVPKLRWNTVSLAWLGSRFWVSAFKRTMAWEQVRDWTDKDNWELQGMQAFAKRGRTSLIDGYNAYKVAWDAGRRQTAIERTNRFLKDMSLRK